MKLSHRLDKLPPYLFVEINRKIAEKQAKGEDIISFAIGDPDMPTPQLIIDQLCQAAYAPANHRYPETAGLPELCQAIARWYQKRFAVTLDPSKEVLPLIGSKEGVGHISFCFIDPGDLALVPDPGYPVYFMSTLLAGGKPYFMPLTEKNDFLPDLESIPEKIPEAREAGIEFHSLSKTYNMTGWRIGMAVGNARMIDALFRFKSNLDSGIPQAIQQAAIKALNGPQGCIDEHNTIYQRRRNKLVKALNDVGLRAG